MRIVKVRTVAAEGFSQLSQMGCPNKLFLEEKL
jgi:hypothetical protein